MDTRTKIVDAARAAELAATHTVVSGYFDPVTAWHARRLAGLSDGRPVLALVRDTDDPILTAGARAELLAALGSVAAVCVTPQWTGRVDAALEDEDLAARAEFVAHVRARQQPA